MGGISSRFAAEPFIPIPAGKCPDCCGRCPETAANASGAKPIDVRANWVKWLWRGLRLHCATERDRAAFAGSRHRCDCASGGRVAVPDRHRTIPCIFSRPCPAINGNGGGSPHAPRRAHSARRWSGIAHRVRTYQDISVREFAERRKRLRGAAVRNAVRRATQNQRGEGRCQIVIRSAPAVAHARSNPAARAAAC